MTEFEKENNLVDSKFRKCDFCGEMVHKNFIFAHIPGGSHFMCVNCRMKHANLNICIEIKSKNGDFSRSIETHINVDTIKGIIEQFKVNPVKEFLSVLGQQLEFDFPCILRDFPDKEEMIICIRTLDGSLEHLVNVNFKMDKEQLNELGEQAEKELVLIIISQIKVEFEKCIEKLI